MDPQYTLWLAMSSFANGDRADALEHLRDLTDWIDRGGFLPTVRMVDGCRLDEFCIPADCERATGEHASELTPQPIERKDKP